MHKAFGEQVEVENVEGLKNPLIKFMMKKIAEASASRERSKRLCAVVIFTAAIIDFMRRAKQSPASGNCASLNLPFSRNLFQFWAATPGLKKIPAERHALEREFPAHYRT